MYVPFKVTFTIKFIFNSLDPNIHLMKQLEEKKYSMCVSGTPLLSGANNSLYFLVLAKHH